MKVSDYKSFAWQFLTAVVAPTIKSPFGGQDLSNSHMEALGPRKHILCVAAKPWRKGAFHQDFCLGLVVGRAKLAGIRMAKARSRLRSLVMRSRKTMFLIYLKLQRCVRRLD